MLLLFPNCNGTYDGTQLQIESSRGPKPRRGGRRIRSRTDFAPLKPAVLLPNPDTIRAHAAGSRFILHRDRTSSRTHGKTSHAARATLERTLRRLRLMRRLTCDVDCFNTDMQRPARITCSARRSLGRGFVARKMPRNFLLG